MSSLKMKVAMVFGAAAAIVAVGCSSSSSGGSGGTYSCSFAIAGIMECSEYTNLPSADDSEEENVCKEAGGTSGTGCSTTDSLGSCAVTAGQVSYSTFYYSNGGETASEAESSCKTSGGTWTAS